MNTIMTENQRALDYAMYMIVGSNFGKTDFSRSRIIVDRLRLNYVERRVNEQYLMEDLCIGFVENFLMKRLPEGIWGENVVVHMINRGENAPTGMIFSGESFALEVFAELKKKNKMEVKCRFYSVTSGTEMEWKADVLETFNGEWKIFLKNKEEDNRISEKASRTPILVWYDTIEKENAGLVRFIEKGNAREYLEYLKEECVKVFL